MAQVAEPTGKTGTDNRAAHDRSGVAEPDRETARRVGQRGTGGWVLLGVASVGYAFVAWMLAGIPASLLPLAADSPVPRYLHLLLAAAATGLAAGFTAGLRRLVAAVPMVTAAVLASVVYAATGGGVDPFFATLTAGSVGSLLGVALADRYGAPRTAALQPTRAPSRRGGLLWALSALAIPVLVVVALYANSATDLVRFELAAGALAISAALGTGACVAQARSHSGRQPRWGLSMFLGVMAATIALYAGYIVSAMA